jgi:glycosyltransferase involved in cell wall biosynthesis
VRSAAKLAAVIGISLLTLVPGIVGGSETYARNLVRSLARTGTHEYRVFVPTIAQDAADGLPWRSVTAYRASRSPAGRAAAMALATVRAAPLRRQLEPSELAGLHFPLTHVLPSVSGVPTATTILDVQHLDHPEFFGRAELAFRRLTYGRAVRASRLVVVISAFVRERVVERLGVAPDHVRVIHLGVNLERYRPGAAPRQPFLLYPANHWPHKNHERLLEAFALARRERPELRLVLTGAGHEGHPLPDGVESRGRVPEDELVHLLQTASALVFPSLYEGFGQPPVEAMACGCPVTCSGTTALPEVVGDAARTFDPTSAEDIAAGIGDVLDDPAPYVERGLERAQRFGWDACARAHDAVYAELAAGAGG